MDSANIPGSGGYWLSKDKDSEYDQVHYYLKASCLLPPSAVLEKLEVWKIQNSEFNYQYQRKTKNMLKLASWMNARSLSREENSLEKICDKGFTFNAGVNGVVDGMEFCTGVIEQFTDIDTNNASEFEKDQTFVYNELAVGRSFICSSDLVNQSDIVAKIPTGYDSLYIPSKPLDRDKDGKFSLQEYQAAARFDNREPTNYHHRYFMKDPLQICPKYIVKFKIAKAQDPAKINGLSARDSLSDYDSVYLDPISFTPVVLNRANENGVIGGGSNRNLISIDQAFDQAIEDGSSSDPITESKEKYMESQLGALDEKVREINLNYAEISEAITKASEEAHAKLQKMTKEKLHVCLSMEVELRRQQEQLQWLDASIAKQLKTISASFDKKQLTRTAAQISNQAENKAKLEFLRSWKCHTVFRNALSRSRPSELQSLSSVHGDIKVQADINIFQDPFFARGLGSKLDNPSMDPNDPAQASTKKKDRDSGFMLKFSRGEKGLGPVRPTHSLVPMPLQNLVDAEVESIQAAIQHTLTSSSSVPLPASIVRPALTGEDYALPLHDLLSGLKDQGKGSVQPSQPRNLSWDPSQTATSGNTMDDLPTLPPSSYPGTGAGGGPLPPIPVPSSPQAMSSSGSPRGSPADRSKAFDVKSEFMANLRHTMVTGPTGSTAMMGVVDDDYSLSGGGGDSIEDTILRNSGSGLGQGQGLDRGAYGKSACCDHSDPNALPMHTQPPYQHTNGSPISTNSGMGASNINMHSQRSKRVGNTNTSNASKLPMPHHKTSSNSDEYLSTVAMTLAQLERTLASYFPKNSLADIAARKLNIVRSKRGLPLQDLSDSGALDSALELGKDFEDGLNSLSRSEILASGAEAMSLYFSLPYFSQPPYCTRIYSTYEHERSIDTMYSMTMRHKNPCFMLIKQARPPNSNGIDDNNVFGAYLSHPLLPTAQWSGSPSCFLFNLSLGVKLPYHARNAADVGAENPLAFFMQADHMYFGYGDLSINADLRSGTSELENCYGLGLAPGGQEALCMLAGSPVFEIEEIEIWDVSISGPVQR